MNVDVFFTRHDLEKIGQESLGNATCVVLDVLRASSAIVQAISAGAVQIYIAGSPDEAFALREKLGPDILLCGEREGLIVPGFDIGNSPLDYTGERVGGRTLVYASTNGSKTLLACDGAKEVLVGGFVNLPALIDRIAQCNDLFLVCSGKLGRFSIEDAVCAGAIIDGLITDGAGPILTSDSAVTARWLFDRYLSSPDGTLEMAEHPVYLARHLGFLDDVAFCTQIGSHSVVPIYFNGVVRR